MFANNDGKFEILAKYKTNGKEYELDAVVSGNKYDLLARQEDIEELVDTEGEVSVKVIDNRPKHLKLDFVNKKYNLNDEEVDFYDVADFKRLTKAWDFDEEAETLVEYEIDEPRFKNGLFLEPESTNLWIHGIYDRFPNINAESGYDVSVADGFDGPIPNETSIKVTRVGKNARYAVASGGYTRFHRSAFYRSDIDGSVGILNMDERAIPISTRWKRYSKIGSNNQLHLFDFRVSGNTLEEAYVTGLQIEEKLVTSHIVTEDTPTTRAKDHLVLNIPKGYTVKGDWDDTLELYEQNGRLQYNGYGVIRTLEVLPITKKYTIDFTQDAIVSNTGFIHKDIFSRGLLEFERLSKAWDFIDGELKEYYVNEPRFSEKGLLIEPQITNDMSSGDFRNNYPESLAQVTTGVDSGLGFKYTSFVGGGKQREGVAFGIQAVSLFPLVTDEVRGPRGVSFLVKAEAPVRYMRISTYATGMPITHVYNTTIDLSDGSVVRQYGEVFVVINVAPMGGGWLRVDFVDNVASNNYRKLNITFGMDGEDGLVPSTWTTLPEGVEVGLALPQHVIPPVYSSLTNNYDTPTTRLPETLTVLTDLDFTIDADDGIKMSNKEIEGFGYIRKIEVTE